MPKRRKKLVKTPRNTRIGYINKIRTANIMLGDIVFGTISEESNDAGEFDWVIRIDWKVWDTMPQAFPGVDVDLRLDEYIRTYIPVFVEQRTLPDTRDYLYETLNIVDMEYNDRFEYMCRTHGHCGNNDFWIDRLSEVIVDPHTGRVLQDIMQRPRWEDLPENKYWYKKKGQILEIYAEKLKNGK